MTKDDLISRQPKRTEEHTETHACDLIDRQAAIDALRTCYDTETVTMDNGDEYINYGDAIGEIEQLPSAQPEIIRCKDCRYYTPIKRTDRWWCRCDEGLWQSNEDDFCSMAERRTDDLQ